MFKVIKFVTGEIIICDYNSTNSTMTNPLGLNFTPEGKDGENLGVGVIPFTFGFVSNDKMPITINYNNVVYIADPNTQLVESYTETCAPFISEEKPNLICERVPVANNLETALFNPKK